MIHAKKLKLPELKMCNFAKKIFERKFNDLIMINEKYPKVMEYINQYYRRDDITLIEFSNHLIKQHSKNT